MGINNKKARHELLEWVGNKYTQFVDWCKPNPLDSPFKQTLKTILKVPVILFAIACSPVMLILLSLILFLML